MQGITKSISRYPTFKRRVEDLIKAISEYFNMKNGHNEARTMPRSKSAFGRFFNQKSLSSKTSNRGSDPESQLRIERNVEIE